MWMSRDFHREYVTAQAVKLAIVDAAFATRLGQAPAAAMPLAGRPVDGSLYEAA